VTVGRSPHVKIRRSLPFPFLSISLDFFFYKLTLLLHSPTRASSRSPCCCSHAASPSHGYRAGQFLSPVLPCQRQDLKFPALFLSLRVFRLKHQAGSRCRRRRTRPRTASLAILPRVSSFTLHSNILHLINTSRSHCLCFL